MTGFIRHNRRITTLIGLAVGLLAAAPGILTEIEVSGSLLRQESMAFFLLAGIVIGFYWCLTASALLFFGFKGLVSIGYYGGWTTLGILIALIFFKTGCEINESYPIIITVMLMTLLQHWRVDWLDRLTGTVPALSPGDEVYFDFARNAVVAALMNNAWVEKRLRAGVMSRLEERDGKLLAINYSLYSPDQIRHRDFSRCFKIELTIAGEKGRLPVWVGRRINRLARDLQQTRQSFFAGAILDPDQQTGLIYVCYNPQQAPVVYRKLLRWAGNTPGQPGIHSYRDPLWRTYYTELRPDVNLQQHLINENFCRHHEHHHFDMTAETGLLFLLSFPDVPRMQHALDILNKESYAQLDAPEEERGRHYLVVRRETRIGAERLNMLTDRLADILSPLNGRLVTYDMEDRFRKTFDLPLRTAAKEEQ